MLVFRRERGLQLLYALDEHDLSSEVHLYSVDAFEGVRDRRLRRKRAEVDGVRVVGALDRDGIKGRAELVKKHVIPPSRHHRVDDDNGKVEDAELRRPRVLVWLVRQVKHPRAEARSREVRRRVQHHQLPRDIARVKGIDGVVEVKRGDVEGREVRYVLA